MKRSRVDASEPAKRARGALNSVPELSTKRLNVYMFGSGTICELGLGPNVTNVKRPRLNPLLSSEEVGIVALACGGAHTVALDHNGHLWTWGQNDSGALGRPTKETEEQIDEDNDLNSRESTPGRVTGVKDDLKFVAVGATDNLSAAIDDDGRVWAWGTFIEEGAKAFSTETKYQTVPVRMRSIRGRASALAGGKDHILILTTAGDVYAWGIGTSYQLGIRVRKTLRTLTQGPVKVPGLRDIVHVAAGDYQSFAVTSSGKVFSWGLNNFGQAGIPDQVGAGAFLERPTHVPFWDDKHIAQIASGNHHTVWRSQDGKVWTQGETNFHQIGIPYTDLPSNTVREQDGTPSFVPTPVPLSKGSYEGESVALPPFKWIAAGTDHSLAISSTDGSAWTWGFGEVFQLGHGKPAGEDEPEDEPIPRRIKNTATLGVNMCWAGAGGQYSVIAAAIEDQSKKEE